MGHAEQKKYPSQNGNPAVSEGDVGGGSGGQESKQQQWAKDLLKVGGGDMQQNYVNKEIISREYVCSACMYTVRRHATT